MPELPEVDTVARQLREGDPQRGPSVVGRTIAYVTVHWPRHIARPTPAELQARLPGQTIRAVTRRAKYVVFQLDRDVLLIHLKMTGDLKVMPHNTPPAPHDRTIFHFTNGYELRFNDARKFGKVFLVERMEEVTGLLGPEPLEADFTAPRLAAQLAHKHRALKPLLLDQTFIAGIGNIYADEALHRAKLHPLRRSDSLRPDEVRALWRSIRTVLRLGLRHNGASIDWSYQGGGYQRYARVYDRAGQPCKTCHTPIRRIIIGQRSTHFCPRCQPARYQPARYQPARRQSKTRTARSMRKNAS